MDATTVITVIRRLFRVGMFLGVVAGVAAALAKLLSGQEPDPLSLASQPPEPWPVLKSDPTSPATPTERAIPDPQTRAPANESTARIWVEPAGDVCPTSHPVKAKLSSKIFHLPGMMNYERTNPDRCYADAAGAESDGLRAAKR